MLAVAALMLRFAASFFAYGFATNKIRMLFNASHSAAMLFVCLFYLLSALSSLIFCLVSERNFKFPLMVDGKGTAFSTGGVSCQ